MDSYLDFLAMNTLWACDVVDFVDQMDQERQPYRMVSRRTVNDFSDVDFRKYFRLQKDSFGVLLDLVRADIDGDPTRP